LNKQIVNTVQLWLSIALMSSSGALGRYIGLAPEVTIWIRCVIGAIVLYVTLKFLKSTIFVGWGKIFWIIVLTTLLLGGHWVTYFYALKLSNVAVGMLSMFTYPVITAVLEPWILGVKYKTSDIALTLVAFLGLFFLISELSFENQMTIGVTCGVFSALMYALRNITIKKSLSSYSGITLMFYQLIILSVVMCPTLFIDGLSINYNIFLNDWSAILILGVITTATGHTLFVISIKRFSVVTVSILSCLSPLFGILLAYLFLDEIPEGNVLIGGGVIFTTVLVESLKSVKASK